MGKCLSCSQDDVDSHRDDDNASDSVVPTMHNGHAPVNTSSKSRPHSSSLHHHRLSGPPPLSPDHGLPTTMSNYPRDDPGLMPLNVSQGAPLFSSPPPGGPSHHYHHSARPLSASMNGSRSNAGTPSPGTGLGASGDKNSFSQYPKLPPINRSSPATSGGSLVTANTPSPSASSGNRHSGGSGSREFSESKIGALFESYRDPDDEDMILADGIERFCEDLEVRPEEFLVLLLAWKFQAQTMCRFTRAEFVGGCRRLRVDSIRGIQGRFPELLKEVIPSPAPHTTNLTSISSSSSNNAPGNSSNSKFKELYRWTYKFGLDADSGQRTLPADMAISLWRLVFSEHNVPVLERWLDFLQDHPNVRGIPKDTWDMFLNFVEAVGTDLSSYDDTEAWPSLFDDFVEYENDRQNQNVKTHHRATADVERDY